MNWKDSAFIPQSLRNFIQSIVDQVPEVMGARAMFERGLDQLATGGQWQFLVINEDGELAGTNNEEFALWLEEESGLFVHKVGLPVPEITPEDFPDFAPEGNDEDEDD